MDNRNTVVVIGRLVAEPELRYLPSGDPLVGFAIAVNRSIRKPDGSFEDVLDGFFDCELYGPAAVTVAELGKGAEVQVTGSLLQNKFKTKAGQNVSKIQIKARTVARLLRAPRTEAAAAPATQPAVAQPAVAQPVPQVPQPA